MAIDNKFEHVEPDDPRRCQACHAKGQCAYKAMDGSSYCPMHGGAKGAHALVAKSQRAYQLAKWQGQVDSFADEDGVKSLRGEIGITRLLLQQVVGRCKDSGEMIMMSGKIGDLVSKIEKLVVSCHRLETNMGQLLDKTKVMDLAAQMIAIIGQHIQDETVLSMIADDIVAMIASAESTTKEDKL